MNIAQAKCIPISDYLSRQGIKPQKSRQAGRELWFHSPIREGDENPSFKVDTIKNIWFDHGAATGGNIIDLVRGLCSCDIRDALQHLDKTGLYSPALSKPTVSPGMSRGASRQSEVSSGNEVSEGEKEKNGPLKWVSYGAIKHPALLQYLSKRKISHDVARKYLYEITFTPPETPAKYFGLGYPA